MTLKLDDRGLIPAVAQDRFTGEVRMVAWMNEDAIRATIETGFATFYSRSRDELWQKGQTSGNRLRVDAIRVDCDRDTLILLVDPEGPTCHTGRASCFFTRFPDDDEPDALRAPYLVELESVIEARATVDSAASYTRSLLEGGAGKIAAKVGEEAAELGTALASESDERVTSEAADVLYHLMVGLRLRGLSFRAVIAELARRAATSGHAEKAARATKPE